MVCRRTRWQPDERYENASLSSRRYRVHANTFAARAGRWSAQHRKTAIWGWIAFVAVAFVIGGAVGVKKPTDYIGPGDSGRADQLALDHFPKDQSESVLIQAPKGASAQSAAVRNAVGDTIAAVRGKARVDEIQSPYAEGNESQVAKDGRSVLVTFKVRGDQDQADDAITPIVDAVHRVQAQNPGVFVGEFGGASADKALSKSFSDDFKKAEKLSLPITLLILVVAFGALVAAGIPLLLALSAVLATLGIVALVSQVLPMSDSVSAIILLIGLAVGVDYTMFYLKREREERAKGRSAEEALEVAAATSGRSVLISGFTVLVAMVGMLLTGDADFASFGVATMAVVAVAMLGSLTVLPALLSKLGDRVDRGQVPGLQRLRARRVGSTSLWSRFIDHVLRRPVLSATLSGGLLLLLALPALQLHTARPSIDTYPQDLLTTYNRMKVAYPGTEISADVVVKATDVTSAEAQAAVSELKETALATGLVNDPVEVTVNPAHTVGVISLPIEGDGTDATSNRALDALRD